MPSWMVTAGFYTVVTGGALLLEAACGYPASLQRAIGHPVEWMGRLVAGMDRRLNHDRWTSRVRRVAGCLGLAVLLLAVGIPAVLVQLALLRALPVWVAWPCLTLLVAAFPAQRSLHEFVAAVGRAVREGGLPAGRAAVAHIVGRNPDRLDEAGVMRAAIESLAENFSDGVVAPAFWGCVCGLPGIALYKAINTADSMIGHRTLRHEAYGWAAARLDDLVNLPGSRLAALWIGLASCLRPRAAPGASVRAVFRDAPRHRSPNAGWPEAAMAGALGLRLAGPRVYGSTLVDDAWMGDGRADATPADLDRALALYRAACAVQIAVLLTLAAAAFIARG